MSSREYILTLTCPDQPGIVHKVSGFIAGHGGNILESSQFGDQRSKRFCMRIRFAVVDVDEAKLRDDFAKAAEGYGMTWGLYDNNQPSRVLIMVSKLDHCLADLLYRQRIGELNIEIPAVVSNHRDTYQLVASHDIPFHHIEVNNNNKPAAEAQLLELIEKERIDFVVLARYMQVLSSELCEKLEGRIVNIHHSFLPGFKGARPYHQAYERGVKLIGATAHFATSELDEGPIIEQDVHRVSHAQSATDLARVGRDLETRVLARAVAYLAEHRVALNGNRTIVFT